MMSDCLQKLGSLIVIGVRHLCRETLGCEKGRHKRTRSTVSGAWERDAICSIPCSPYPHSDGRSQEQFQLSVSNVAYIYICHCGLPLVHVCLAFLVFVFVYLSVLFDCTNVRGCACVRVRVMQCMRACLLIPQARWIASRVGSALLAPLTDKAPTPCACHCHVFQTRDSENHTTHFGLSVSLGLPNLVIALMQTDTRDGWLIVHAPDV
jgi:hypothetical protein